MPEFSKTDLELSMTLDGSTITTTPSKGAYTISVTCDKGATGYWDYDAWAVVVGNINEVKVKCAIAFKTGSPKFNEYIMAKSEVTNSGVEKVTHEDTIQTGSNAKIDYRYMGANPNNYVYFGCEGESCTKDNLYRIIGVIPTQSSENGTYQNRIKLIKASNYTENESGYLENVYTENGTLSPATPEGKGYRWNKDENKNNWEKSPLNEKVLNGVYWNSLGEYQNYIETAKWYLGALNNDLYPSYTIENLYKAERGQISSSSQGNIFFIGNIGLMYPSDYGYSLKKGEAATSIEKVKDIYIQKAWLYTLSGGDYVEWTISPSDALVNGATAAWNIGYPGNIWGGFSVNYYGQVFGIRPTFYLKSSVQYTSGDGSIDNPYRIGL